MRSNPVVQKFLGFILPLSLLLTFMAAGVSSALIINPTFTSEIAGETWTNDRKNVVYQAISDWGSAIENDYTINVTFDFTNAGSNGYLGQWESRGSYYTGDDFMPWYNLVEHTVHFNSYYFDTSLNYFSWFDPTPETDGDLSTSYFDMLSVTRHELGHALGFTDDYYKTKINTTSEISVWNSHITNGTLFDAGGLNVFLAAADNLSHMADGNDLMSPSISNGTRRDISRTDLEMLSLAYGYDLVPVPVPSTCFLLFSGIFVFVLRRRGVGK